MKKPGVFIHMAPEPYPKNLDEVLSKFIGQADTPELRAQVQAAIQNFIHTHFAFKHILVTEQDFIEVAKMGLTYDHIKDYVPAGMSRESVERIMLPYLTPIGKKLYRE